MFLSHGKKSPGNITNTKEVVLVLYTFFSETHKKYQRELLFYLPSSETQQKPKEKFCHSVCLPFPKYTRNTQEFTLILFTFVSEEI